MMKFLAVFIGGGFGAVLRYCITFLTKHICNASICGTLTSNIVGCFLIGLIFGITLNKADFLSENLRLLLAVGFLGGLTTFSTLNIEAFELFKNGKFLFGIFYLIFSGIFGVLFTYFGYLLSTKI